MNDVEVVRALWKNSPWAIPAFGGNNSELPHEEAKKTLESGQKLHLVRGKVMYITFKDKELSDVENYNKWNIGQKAIWAKGQGLTAQQVIDNLRQSDENS